MVLRTTLRDVDSSGVAVTFGGGRGDGQMLLAIWWLFLTLLQLWENEELYDPKGGVPPWQEH